MRVYENEGQTSSYSLLLLTPQHGQRNIVSVAQEMSRLVMQRKLKTSEIDTTMVNKRLSGKGSFDAVWRSGGGCESFKHLAFT